MFAGENSCSKDIQISYKAFSDPRSTTLTLSLVKWGSDLIFTCEGCSMDLKMLKKKPVSFPLSKYVKFKGKYQMWTRLILTKGIHFITQSPEVTVKISFIFST